MALLAWDTHLVGTARIGLWHSLREFTGYQARGSLFLPGSESTYVTTSKHTQAGFWKAPALSHGREPTVLLNEFEIHAFSSPCRPRSQRSLTHGVPSTSFPNICSQCGVIEY